MSAKHHGIAVREKFVVERSGSSSQILRTYHNAEVQKRCALRNHPHVDVLQGTEHAGRDAGGVPKGIADSAQNRSILLDRYFGKRFELRTNLSQARIVVYRQRQANLGGG